MEQGIKLVVVEFVGGPLDGEKVSIPPEKSFVMIGYAVQEAKTFFTMSDDGFDPVKPFNRYVAVYKTGDKGKFYYDNHNLSDMEQWGFITHNVVGAIDEENKVVGGSDRKKRVKRRPK